MKNKIKLTELSHLESLNDEMAYLKGGDENGPNLCYGCSCACTCTNPTPSSTTTDSTFDSTRRSGWVDKWLHTPVRIYEAIFG